MHPLLILASFLALAPSPAGATPANKRAEARVTMRTHMFRGAYEPPKNPQHQELYEFLKKSQVLESSPMGSAPSGCPGRS